MALFLSPGMYAKLTTAAGSCNKDARVEILSINQTDNTAQVTNCGKPGTIKVPFSSLGTWAGGNRRNRRTRRQKRKARQSKRRRH